MTAMDTRAALTVGQVAERFGVTVRTLHHYHEIGLLVPEQRTRSGYRLYGASDLDRLQHVVVYRRLGFSLEEVADLLDDPGADVGEHLRRQRDAVTTRLDELSGLVVAIDAALEAHMSGMALTHEERRELFGDEFAENFDTYQAEAEQRWGDTDAWRQSQRRTAEYTKDDWRRMMADQEAVGAAFATAMQSGEPANSVPAMEVAEAHRQHIERWCYDIGYDTHRGLGDMYVADERFRKHFDDRAPGLAEYVRDAIHANADARS